MNKQERELGDGDGGRYVAYHQKLFSIFTRFFFKKKMHSMHMQQQNTNNNSALSKLTCEMTSHILSTTTHPHQHYDHHSGKCWERDFGLVFLRSFSSVELNLSSLKVQLLTTFTNSWKCSHSYSYYMYKVANNIADLHFSTKLTTLTQFNLCSLASVGGTRGNNTSLKKKKNSFAAIFKEHASWYA